LLGEADVGAIEEGDNIHEQQEGKQAAARAEDSSGFEIAGYFHSVCSQVSNPGTC
jgi:hypothetical protein